MDAIDDTQRGIRVVIADDHELVREGLRAAFGAVTDVEIVGEAGTADRVIDLVAAEAPDVIVVDDTLPDGDLAALTRRLRQSQPAMGIVWLSARGDDRQLLAALDAGASAYVPKAAPSASVVSASLHAARSPGTFLADDLTAALARQIDDDVPTLSPREDQVLRRLAAGASIAEVARALFISESTTKTHITRLYDKLGATNRAQAIMAGMRLGILSAADFAVDGDQRPTA